MSGLLAKRVRRTKLERAGEDFESFAASLAGGAYGGADISTFQVRRRILAVADMYTKTGWYARASAIWIGALAAGGGLTYLLFLLPWHPYVLGAMDTALWLALGFALSGPWSYASCVREAEERR